MCETAVFPLLVKNLMTPSCFLMPISSRMRKFRRFAYNTFEADIGLLIMCMDLRDLLA